MSTRKRNRIATGTSCLFLLVTASLIATGCDPVRPGSSTMESFGAALDTSNLSSAYSTGLLSTIVGDHVDPGIPPE